MANTTQILSKIVDGPSKDGLKAALFDRMPFNSARVKFSLEKSFNYEVTILSVEAEDGSRESWNIRGSAYLMIQGAKIPSPGRRVRIYFRTDSRKGTMTFLS